MRLGTKLSLACVLLSRCSFGYALPPCDESLEFSSDGSVAEWSLCHHGKRFRAVGSDSTFLQVVIGHAFSSQPLPLNWSQDVSTDAETRFVAKDDQESIRLERIYRRGSNAEFTHLVRMSGFSQQSRPELMLRIDPGNLATSDSTRRWTLADLVYEFSHAYISEDGKIWKLAETGDRSNRIAISSRHKVVILESAASFSIEATPATDEESDLAGRPGAFVIVPEPDSSSTEGELVYRQDINIMPMQTAVLADAGYESFMFANLWDPLAKLSKWIEDLLILMSRITGGLGPAVILLAVAIRLLSYPASLWAARKQHEYAAVAERMRPLIADIRAKYKGAEQSERILSVYQEHQVSPFTGLKGSIGLFVQIPFLLAVFNVTTASSVFANEPFLWITDLSLADRAFSLPTYLPILGDSVNALPLILGAINIAFADAPSAASASARWTPILSSVTIVLVFYSFCAAIVLYWLTVNVLQIVERQIQTRLGLLNKHRTPATGRP